MSLVGLYRRRPVRHRPVLSPRPQRASVWFVELALENGVPDPMPLELIRLLDNSLRILLVTVNLPAASGCSAQQKTKPLFYGAEQGFTEDIERRTR
jgi:hypothetical protein